MKQLFTSALLSLILTNQVQSADAPAHEFRDFFTRCLTCIYEQGLHDNIFAPCAEMHITVRYPQAQEERVEREVLADKQRVAELHARYKGSIGNRAGATITISLND